MEEKIMKRWILITGVLLLIGVASCANNKGINVSGTLKERLISLIFDVR
jgi:hypothetical protein